MVTKITKAARNFVLQKEKVRRSKLELKFNQAKNDFNLIVKIIKKKYNPYRIYQWGSLLNKSNFSEISDIDIAVEGVTSAEKFFAMYRDAEDVTRFPLHLVQIEKISPMYAKWIKTDGKIIYEAR